MNGARAIRGAGHDLYLRALLAMILLGLLAIPIAVFAAVIDSSGRLSVVLSGLLCILAIGFPFLLPGKRATLYEPLVLMCLSVLIGSTLRAFYISYSGSARVPVLMMNQTYLEIAEYSIWLILGLFCIGLGYAVTKSRAPIERVGWLFDRVFDTGQRFNLALMVAIATVLIGSVLFIESFDIGFSIDSLSGKRAASLTTDDGEEVYSSLGYIRVMSQIGASALYYYVAALLYHGRRFTLPRTLLLFFLFSISAIVPFLSSSRSEVGVMIMNTVILFLVFGRLRMRLLVVSVLLVVGIAVGMAQLRSIAQGDNSYREGESFVDAIVGSANFVDMARTGAIIERIPAQVGFLLGSSYVSLFTAPIPKVLWPDKPNPSLGPWVRSEVFGVWVRNNGWPPNIVGEAYINFGYLGIAPVCFLFGALIRFLYNSFSVLIPRNPVATVIYVSIFFGVGMKIIQLNFAQGIIIAAQSAVSTILFVLLAAPRRRGSLAPAGSRAGRGW